MKKISASMVVFAAVLALSAPAFAQDELAKRMNDVLSKGMTEGHWWVSAEELNMWMKTGKTDFVVVDVRPSATAFKLGHVPGAVHIPYNAILEPENLAKLPKDKKLVLMCNTGQLQNLPVVPLRVLGYDAATLALGYTAWMKDSMGARQMRSAAEKAATKNYPIQSEAVTPAEE
jgi:rhodanese-related sulfurtransferase